MAKDQGSFPKTVVLSMDECKLVVKSIECNKAVVVRAGKKAVADGLPDVADSYARLHNDLSALALKF